ncbi:MAG: methylmalonyl-CoA mutase family protein, partial [Polaribacter sp.]|nr:methylmalonyl-CoA mutase family protein [Polaribacter sp.]
MEQITPYKPQHKVRIVTAASLFDGHDASINILRRIIQATGVEVIHLGHDRSVEEVVNCAIQEDVNAIAMTSYQGGHNEYFKYMYDLLQEKGAGHIKIFAGGGGVILPEEIKDLMEYGITRIYSPDDGRSLGLQGMINDLIKKSEQAHPNLPEGKKLQSSSKKNGKVCNEDGDWLLELGSEKVLENLKKKDINTIARLISLAENNHKDFDKIFNKDWNSSPSGRLGGAPVLGITGTGGAGKSSLVDELVRRFLIDFPEKKVGLISVDPSKRKTGGALLGDRIRMNAIHNDRVYMRSLATRQSNLALSKHVNEAIEVLKAAEFDLIILETSGIGQSDTEIIEHSDTSLYVMTPEFGAATQLEKIDMLDFADLVAINKFDKRGALDAVRDVKKQYMRNNNLWHIHMDDMPVYGTIASQFNDPGMNTLYKRIMDKIVEKTGADLKSTMEITKEMSEKIFVIPPSRVRYLSEIAENNRAYDTKVDEQVVVAQKLYGIHQTIESIVHSSVEIIKTGLDEDEILKQVQNDDTQFVKLLIAQFEKVKLKFDPLNWEIILNWQEKVQKYKDPIYTFKVRDKEINIETHSESLSHSQIPKIALPKYKAWGDLLRWNLQENVPGEFPFAAGLYPFKRTGEDPTRMFAGEGGPERTNRRFHYVSLGMDAKRLSTAFDSVTLYGNDPGKRPDIYGKIGNAGVSICCLDDAKKLYSGFDL